MNQIQVKIHEESGGYFGTIDVPDRMVKVTYHAFERFQERIGINFDSPHLFLKALASLWAQAKKARRRYSRDEVYETWMFDGWEFVIDPASCAMITCYPSKTKKWTPRIRV